MERFRTDKDVHYLVKSIKRFKARRASTVHFGFRVMCNDYIYFTTQNNVTEFDMKHPDDHGCKLHFNNLKQTHLLYIAECMKAKLVSSNKDIFEILTEDFGLEY